MSTEGFNRLWSTDSEQLRINEDVRPQESLFRDLRRGYLGPKENSGLQPEIDVGCTS